jgi:hypothetical protein
MSSFGGHNVRQCNVIGHEKQETDELLDTMRQVTGCGVLGLT